jgi:prevent-host-death family protein
MLEVPASEAQREFGFYERKALTQPVAVTHDGEPRIVMISIEEYRRLKRRDRRVFRTEDAPDEIVAAILAAGPPLDADQFDHEVE